MRPDTIIRWIARLLGITSTMLLLMFIFGGRENLQFTPREAVGFLLFPVGVIVGFFIAWRRELVGGLVTVGSLALFAVYFYATSGRVIGLYFILFAAPGFLHIVSAILADRSRGNSDDRGSVQESLTPNKRTNVTFRHPAEFVSSTEYEDILAASSARWFAAILQRVPDLQIDENLCQEDWGVVFFAQRNEMKFWIGLSQWDEDGIWVAHFHHGSFSWKQWFSSSGNHELNRLLDEVHQVFANEPSLSEITWYAESEIRRSQPTGYPTP